MSHCAMTTGLTAPQGQCRAAFKGQTQTTLSSRSAIASRASLQTRQQSAAQSHRLSVLQVNCALSKERKVETVEKLVTNLQESSVVFGVRFQNVSVKNWQEFRQSMPEESNVVVCKNTLMKLAIDKTEGWQELKEVCKGENAWLFVREENIAASIKAYLAFEKKVKEPLPKEKRAESTLVSISGGAMDGKLLNDIELKRLEKMPTKVELIATIARLINQVPTKVARGINAVPTKLAYGVKALADGDDNKELVVGELFPKPAADSA